MKPTDDMMQCPACHGQAPDFRCRYCEGVGGVTEDRFHAYHDKAMRPAGPSVLVKRPAAFRIRRADADTAGATLSETDWRYFSNEDDAYKASDALGTEYQCLYTRDGTAVSADLEDVRAAILDTLKKSAPGISEPMRVAICNSIVIKLRNPR
jgi:hypothetical protein